MGRLDLIAESASGAKAAVVGRGVLGEFLGVGVTDDWPPEIVEGAPEFLEHRLGEHPRDLSGSRPVE